METPGNIGRREFIAGAVAAVAKESFPAGAASCGDVVMVSDEHVSGDSAHGIFKSFSAIVDEILALDPRPARVVSFGDMSHAHGRKADYSRLLPLFMRLKNAGMELSFLMGNHDRRGPFREVFGDLVAPSPFKSRIVSLASAGELDLILLDTLDESGDPSRPNAVEGRTGPAQIDWARQIIKERKRPAIVCAHHPQNDSLFRDLIFGEPLVCGVIHGHEHFWSSGFYRKPAFPRLVRKAGLPSTGIWGDIGYAVLRQPSPGRAELRLRERDFFFPHQPKRGTTDPLSESIMRDNNAAVCSFTW
jgi:hypothetical protein